MYGLGIEAFLAIVRTRSLSKAAENLNIAQTTVSQRLKTLEQELGMPLIERSKGIREISITAAGEEFLKIAEQWDILAKAAKKLQTHGPYMSLSVGTIDSVNSFILPKVYQAVTNHDPIIKLEIHTSHTVDLYADVENRRVDIAFVLRKLSQPNVYLKKYFSIPMVVLRSKDSINKTDNKVQFIHPSALNAEHELYMPWGQENFRTWHDFWWPPFIAPQIKLDNARILLGLLRDPEQWALAPLNIATEAVRLGNFSIFHLTDPPPDYTCYMLSHVKPTSLTAKATEIFDTYFRSINAPLF